MAIYERLWGWLATVAATLATLIAYMLRPTDQFIVVGLTGLTLGAGAGFLYGLKDEKFSARSIRNFGIVGCAAVLALLGLHALFGPFAVAGGVIFLLADPWLSGPPAQAIGTKMGGGRRPGLITAPEVSGKMDDQALLAAWHATTTALSHIRSDPDWLSLVQQRHDYLDEMERRHPQGFAAWMAAIPDLATDPAWFFHGSTPDTGGGDQQ